MGQQQTAKDDSTSAWVLSTKREGDRIGNWVVAKLFEDNKRQVSETERCQVTSFCYPSGARLVRARLRKVAKTSPEPVTLN